MVCLCTKAAQEAGARPITFLHQVLLDTLSAWSDPYLNAVDPYAI